MTARKFPNMTLVTVEVTANQLSLGYPGMQSIKTEQSLKIQGFHSRNASIDGRTHSRNASIDGRSQPLVS